MNRQGRLVNGRWVGGIEWTHVVLPDGRQLPGYTHNPVGGCRHGCEWTTPDGQQAICYAKTTAETLAQGAYPEGFEAHYWRPDQLRAPLDVKEPAGIFFDSMADLFGGWVPGEQTRAVLQVAREAHWHIFLSLTKAYTRLKLFQDDIPANVWEGISSPPDVMFGHTLDQQWKDRYLARALSYFWEIRDRGRIRWMSFEPYMHDYSQLVQAVLEPQFAPVVGRGLPLHERALDWAVIGAASNGTTIYDPDPRHVERLLHLLDRYAVPVFYKGNMRRFTQRFGFPWREEFPAPVGWPTGWEVAATERMHP